MKWYKKLKKKNKLIEVKRWIKKIMNGLRELNELKDIAEMRFTL